jgi:hypothetical protein
VWSEDFKVFSNHSTIGASITRLNPNERIRAGGMNMLRIETQLPFEQAIVQLTANQLVKYGYK